MMSRYKQFANFIATCAAITFVGTSSVRADDTEIFELNPDAADTRPNVLLIIDTSISMDGNVLTQEDWDPSIDFDGSCNDNYIYWQPSNSPNLPSCSGSNQQRISVSRFLCQAALPALQTVGQVTIPETVQWRSWENPDRWHGTLQAGRDTNVECRNDHMSGTHSGLTTNDNRHPRDGNGLTEGFSNSNEINWNNTGSYVFYTGNRLNYLRNSGQVSRTRLEVVQAVAKATLDQLLDGTVNVGLMRFDRTTSGNNSQGGYVLHEIGPIETVRETIKTQIDGLTSESYTPLTETLFEAFRYYTGGAVFFGNRATAMSVPGSRRPPPNSDFYQSPLSDASCQPSFIILLTDGEPTRDNGADAEIQNLPQFANRTSPPAAACSNNLVGGGLADGTGVCLDDIAQYMRVRPDLTAEERIGKTITTFTIGFGPEVDGSVNIQRAAEAGGGRYYSAGDTAGLTNAFTNIFNEIFEDNLTFSAPAVSVNSFNRTQNLNDLFFTVFQPTNAFHWPGNLKKYRLDPNDLEIKDANGNNAVDPDTGFFYSTAQSIWSAAPDGTQVAEGGAAHRLPSPASRNLYTDIAAYGGTPIRALTNEANAVSADNALLDDGELLGLLADATPEEIDSLINWARGDFDGDLSTTDDTLYQMGDPLHARAATAIYGGTADNPDMVVFVATNDGYLHAIDGRNNGGNELWAFIPSELLPRLNSLRTNDPPNSKQYGLDGNLRIYRTDENGNGAVDGDDVVVLVFGMGRGGSNYYALDVTNKSSPRLLWRRGAGDTLVGLGQSWSTPSIGKIRLNGVEKTVAVIGGGYDPTQDNVAYNTDDVGNRIFIVDLFTGDLLWSAGPTSSSATFRHAKMVHSIPSEVRAIDLNADGYLDRMYVGDMGARLWRFDINNNNTGASTLVAGGVIASLGAANDAAHAGATITHARRFYAAPDVVLLEHGGTRFLSIGIGSGYRGHPLNAQIQDRYYSIRDRITFAPMTQAQYDAFPVITEDNLVDALDNPNENLPVTALGWRLLMNDPSWRGEKVLSESRTINGDTTFTTYSPTGNVVNQGCSAHSGTNYFYCVRTLNGSPSPNCELPDGRRTVLRQRGIAPGPVIVFPKPCQGEDCPDPPPPPCEEGAEDCPPDPEYRPKLLVGAEDVDMDISNIAGRTFWNAPETDTNAN